MTANRSGIRMPRAKRHELVVALKEQGKTFEEIARLMGMARSTITSVYYNPTGEKDHARKARYGGVCVVCGGRTTYLADGVARRCRTCDDEYRRTLPARRIHSRPNRQYSDEQIFGAIRSIARDGIASKTNYERAYSDGQHGQIPSFATITIRFGSWRTAVEAAGLRVRNEKKVRVYANRISDDGLLCAIEDCAAALGHWPGAKEYDDWATGGVAVTRAIQDQRFGSWLNALERAVERNGGKVPR